MPLCADGHGPRYVACSLLRGVFARYDPLPGPTTPVDRGSFCAHVLSVAVVADSLLGGDMPFKRGAEGAGRWRWPFTRRNCLDASTMPAAHQRSAICPSRQRLTFLACSRQIPIIDSIALVERSVRARVGG